MIKCYWLVNHKITESQEDELRRRFGVDAIILPPENVAGMWQAIPVTERIPDGILDVVKDWFSTMDSSDIAVVHGEPTAMFSLVNYLLDKEVRVFASVSERKVIDVIQDGKVCKLSVFEHVCFRPYVK